MLLILHILCALVSFGSMGIAVVAKWQFRDKNFDSLVRLSAATFVGLLVSGVGLIVMLHANVQSVCLNGLLSLAGLSALYGVYRRLSQTLSD